MRAELFLKKYRVLEGLLEKRYEGRRINSSSVVIEYIREEDSEPVRVDLDLLREIRNILAHNAGENGAPVVEPSQEMLDRLDAVTAYVESPRCAADFGTPAEKLLCAHPNDRLRDIMRVMCQRGFSHVPVLDKRGLYGILSIKSVFDYLAERGLDALNEDARISALDGLLRLDSHAERYLFFPADISIVSVRNAFEEKTQPNNRLAAVFLTETGSVEEPLICMLTPWDVLNDGRTN